MDDTKVVILDKHASKVLSWINKASSKNPAKVALMGVNFNGSIAAADGWIAHWVNNIPGLPEDIEGIYEVETKPGANIFQQIDATFPNLDAVKPVDKEGETKISFSVDPALLTRIVSGMDKNTSVKFTLRPNNGVCNTVIEISGIVDDQEVNALIMLRTDY